MKRLINILLFSSITLFASIEQVQEYYDAKQYEKAIKEAKLSTTELSNPKLHFLWGKSAEALGHYEEAMNAYERVEILDSDNVEAKISLFQIYIKTDRDQLALTIAKDLRNYELTTKQKILLDSFRSTKLDSYKVFASFTLGYDTNINIAPGVIENEPLSTDNLNTMFTRLSAAASYTHELEEKGDWYGRTDMVLYNQINLKGDASIYDLFLGGVKFGAGYKDNSYDIFIPVAYDMVNYLDKQLFTQIKIEPKIDYTFSNNLLLNTEVSYINRNYLEGVDKANDDSAIGLGFGAYYLMGQDYYFAKLKYESLNKDDSASQAKYIDKTFLTFNIGANYNLTPWLVTKAGYKFRNADYDDDSRNDRYQQLEVKFSHYFEKYFEAYVLDKYVTNKSNISMAEFNKNIFMFGISANY